MSKKRYWHAVIFIALFLSANLSYGYDSEWPPAFDPPYCGAQANPALAVGEVSVSIPAELLPWLDSRHQFRSIFSGYPVTARIGDIQGQDDGELGLVLYVAGLLVAGIDLDVTWTAGVPTVTTNLLWVWLTPYAKAAPGTQPGQAVGTPILPDGGLGGVAPSTDPHLGFGAQPFVIWDLDGDGANEIAISVIDLRNTSNREIVVLQTDPSATTPLPGFTVPEPAVLASTNAQQNFYGDRIGLIKVRPDGWDLVTHAHDDFRAQSSISTLPPIVGTATGGVAVLRLVQSGGSYSLNTVFQENGGRISHEYNYLDVSDPPDGIEEIFKGGRLNVADSNGVIVPPGPARWSWTAIPTPAHTDQHMDQMFAGDWIRANGRLEILCVPQGGAWTDWEGNLHPRTTPVLLDAADGTVINDNFDAPLDECQTIYRGNWNAHTVSGDPGDLEAFFFPDTSPNGFMACGPNSTNGVQFAGFGQDALGNEIIADGLQVKNSGWMAGGPILGVLSAMNWDGDYDQDELLNMYQCLYVWSMGAKNALGPGVPDPKGPTQNIGGVDYPAGMPPTNNDGLYTVPSCGGTAGGSENWPWYDTQIASISCAFPGPADWGWSNGMAGPYTHYWEKLGEFSPTPYLEGGPVERLWTGIAYDFGGDYREEILVIDPQDIRLVFNTDPLAEPAKHPSPVLSESYRAFRQDPFRSYTFFDEPKLVSIEVTPETQGMSNAPGSTAQLQAFGHYSDGSVHEITDQVAWVPDVDMMAFLNVDPQGVVSPAVLPTSQWETSARFFATTTVDGQAIHSNDAYVFTTPNTNPVVLSAGYKHTYLDSENGTIHVEARVAQRDNELTFAFLSDSAGNPLLLGTGLALLQDNGLGGDEKAGDGIHSGTFQLYNAGSPLAAADYLLTIQAVSIVSGLPVPAAVPWPYYQVGPGFSFQPVAGQTTNFPENPNDAPMIKSAGFRGQTLIPSGVPSHVLLEAEIIPPVTPGYLSIDVFAIIPGVGQVQMTEALPNRSVYTLNMTWPSLPLGTHVVNVIAEANYGTEPGEQSDPWPHLIVHP